MISPPKTTEELLAEKKCQDSKEYRNYAIKNMSEEELYSLHIYHRTNDNYCETQLHSLLGLMIAEQDEYIIKSISGHCVLDVGAGNGDLSRRLKEHGYTVTSIEPHAHTRELAKKWNGIDELPYGIYETPFTINSFDTVILRECVEHLIFEDAIPEIKRICNKRIIIFEPNLNPIVLLARKLVGQKEFNPQKLEYFQKILADNGYTKQTVTFRDVFIIPLSGGFSYRQLVPRYKPIEMIVMILDRKITYLLDVCGLSSFICWRYLLVADKGD